MPLELYLLRSHTDSEKFLVLGKASHSFIELVIANSNKVEIYIWVKRIRVPFESWGADRLE